MKSYDSSENRGKQETRRHPLMRIPVPWVFALTYLAGTGLQFVMPVAVRSGRIMLISHVVGAVLMGFGLTLAAWSLWLFRAARTTTVPGKFSAALVTSGPYRFSRNPMYISLTLMYLGEAGILAQMWPVLALPLVLYYAHRILIPVEEARLRRVFGDDYEQYSARTPRWL